MSHRKWVISFLLSYEHFEVWHDTMPYTFCTGFQSATTVHDLKPRLKGKYDTIMS